jgi:diguanylate cyclase (GGDEF)-like protein
MIGEIAERERRITHLAFNDVLTGLSNRALYHEHLDHQLRLAERRDGGVALLCLDLDDFKSINDTLGHPVGDELLKVVAGRLTDAVEDAFVARLGGDEFVVVLWMEEGHVGLEQVEALGRRLLDVLAAPSRIAGHDVVPRASIGIALSPADGSDPQTLLRNADLALYRAKEAGRNGYCFYEPSLNARAQERRAIEMDLRRAVEEGEFRLHFQPLFDLRKDRISAFEALLRWEHPTRGLVAPTDFIPIAEETGLIVPIGAWVMREASRRAMTWPEHIRIAVNVSSVQFRRPGLAETVMHALQSSGLRPDRLEIEITESIFLDSSDATLRLLHSLRHLGVRVALDDFGTGYSSLSYLQSFPFDKIKIDRSFIIGLQTRQGAAAIVKAITDLATALGMETTAEGVEDLGQLATLRAHGCSSVQGYLFSKPITAHEVDVLLGQRASDSIAAA